MEKSKKSFLWVIPLIIGIIIGCIGISYLARANSISLPSMSSSDWFYLKSERSRYLAIGIVLSIVGLFGLILSATTFILTNTAKKVKNTVKTTITTSQTILTNILSGKKEDNKVKRYCSYCGSLIEEGMSSCSGCGAKVFKENK